MSTTTSIQEIKEKPVNTPYDVNSPSFDSELYSQKVIKEATLSQLMAQETQIVRQIHSLDSDMQTLVYENYNKFISATDTIKQMRVDFRDMEGEMDQLAERDFTAYMDELKQSTIASRKHPVHSDKERSPRHEQDHKKSNYIQPKSQYTKNNKKDRRRR